MFKSYNHALLRSLSRSVYRTGGLGLRLYLGHWLVDGPQVLVGVELLRPDHGRPGDILAAGAQVRGQSVTQHVQDRLPRRRKRLINKKTVKCQCETVRRQIVNSGTPTKKKSSKKIPGT